MKVSRVFIAAAAVAAAAAAHAQSSVTLFGLLDANVSRFSSSGGRSQVVLGTDGYQSSRLGIRGTEDLGGGLAAGFWLEAAINPDTGVGGGTNANNQLSGVVGAGGLSFGRRSTVSLLGPFGELRLGRDYVPGFSNLSSFNPFGTNGVGSSGFLFYPVQAAARITNVRASNAVGYFLPPGLGGVYGQVMFALGENLRNSGVTEKDGRVFGGRLGYAAGPFDIAGATTRTQIFALGDLRQSNVGASYDFGVVKPMVLFNENKVGLTRTRTWLVGALVPAFGVGSFRVAYARVNTNLVANDADQWTVGYVHNLSKRTALYGNFSYLSNKDGGANYNVGLPTTVPNGSSRGLELGVRHSF